MVKQLLYSDILIEKAKLFMIELYVTKTILLILFIIPFPREKIKSK